MRRPTVVLAFFLASTSCRLPEKGTTTLSDHYYEKAKDAGADEEKDRAQRWLRRGCRWAHVWKKKDRPVAARRAAEFFLLAENAGWTTDSDGGRRCRELQFERVESAAKEGTQ